MDEHYSVLTALQENLPAAYSDENVRILEQLVTRYSHILIQIAEAGDPENTTLYYRERLPAIDKFLRDARFEHEEKQRKAAYMDAQKYTEEGITALLFQINNYHILPTTTSEETNPPE